MMNGGLVGQYFWFDEAKSPNVRKIFRGTVAAELGMGYYLIEFAPCDELAEGTREIVHLSRIAEEHWSFFAEPGQLMKAIDGSAR